MKRLFSCLLVTMVLMSVGTGSQAQTKIGYISLQELIVAMPEYKKANSDMAEHQESPATTSERLLSWSSNAKTACTMLTL